MSIPMYKMRLPQPHIFSSIGIILITLSLILAGCKKDPRVTFIQGYWYNKNAHLANIPAESAQVTNLDFDNGYFSIDSCCFTETYYTASYSIAKRDENEMTLELFNMQGQTAGMQLHRYDTQTLVIRIDQEADTISVNGDGPYIRVSP